MVGGRAPKQDWGGMLSQKWSLGSPAFWLLLLSFIGLELLTRTQERLRSIWRNGSAELEAAARFTGRQV